MATAPLTRKTEAKEGRMAMRPFTLLGEFPFGLSRMRDEFDRLFDRLMTRAAPEGANGWRWEITVEDKDDAVVVRAEAPGFEATDFDINVEDNVLTLKACRKTEAKEKEGTTSRTVECYESMTLPAGIEKEKVEATYINGVLMIHLPKSLAAKPKKIAVKPK